MDLALTKMEAKLLGGSWERLGRLLESFWNPVGVLLEVRSPLESGLEVILPNIAKPAKTLEGIAKMEVLRSTSGWKRVKIFIKRESLVEI